MNGTSEDQGRPVVSDEFVIHITQNIDFLIFVKIGKTEALSMRNFRIQLFKIRQHFGRFPDFVIDVETNKNRKSTFGLVTGR